MKKLMVLLLLLILPAALSAAGKKHVKTSAEQECSECHMDQTRVWLEGAHGLMGVKCVVCHGSPEENFMAKPTLNKCRGCHGDMVADVEKLPAKQRTCFLCHENHSVAVKEAAAKDKSGFHREGGAQR